MLKSLFLSFFFIITISDVFSQPQWTWVKGDSTFNTFGVYGTKGIESGTNKPGARKGAVKWQDMSGNIWLFGGEGFAAAGASGKLNDLWKYAPLTNSWTWMSGGNTVDAEGSYGPIGTASTYNNPGGRSDAFGWIDETGNIWLFGGLGYGSARQVQNYLNDLWKYNPSTNEWTWVKGNSIVQNYSAEPVYGIKGTPSPQNAPGHRIDGISWTDKSGNLWMFGGFGFAAGSTSGRLNDLWKYNRNENEWTWMSGDSISEQGGIYGVQYKPSVNNKPTARWGIAGGVDASGKFWLFGGNGPDAKNDLWQYNPSTNEWTWISGDTTLNSRGVYGTKGTPSLFNKPRARSRARGWTDSAGNFLIFGGAEQATFNSGFLNDLWRYNVTTHEWTWLSGDNTHSSKGVYGQMGIPSPVNSPGARGLGTTWTDKAGNIWLYGGLGDEYYNDLWKYNPYKEFNVLSGSIFLDKNLNTVRDASEPLFTAGKVDVVKKAIDSFTIRTSSGSFFLYSDTGTYVTSAAPYLPYYNVVPASRTSSFATYKNTDSFSFTMQPIMGKRDLMINLIATTPARPGFSAVYNIVFANNGTDTVINGVVEVIKDSKIDFNYASINPTSVHGDTLRWNISNLKPFSAATTISINCRVHAAPEVYNGNVLALSSTISSPDADLTPNDNTSKLFQTVVGSYDPNDKKENHGGKIDIGKAIAGEYLVYTIRFQNTGTDTAFTVSVKDTLSDKVDFNSLEMISSSSNYLLTMNEGNCLWTFDNINLVDSNKNEFASHGYLVYRIKAKGIIAVGDMIKNKASIYFDYNLPVATNTDTTIIVAHVLPVKNVSFNITRQGARNVLQWRALEEIDLRDYEVEKSGNGRDFVKIGSEVAGLKNYQFLDEKPLKGMNYYRLKMNDKDGNFEYTVVRRIDNTDRFNVSCYPNPAREKLQVKIISDKKLNLQVQVLKEDGQVMLVSRWTVSGGTSLKMINISSLPSGSYFLKVISSENDQKVAKLEKL